MQGAEKLAWLVALATCVACTQNGGHRAVASVQSPVRDAASFLAGSLRPWPDEGSTGLLAVTDPESGRIATYDSALVVLVLLRKGQRELASRVLRGLAALQQEDGALPFGFTLPAPDRRARYERAGAVAWIGYAAAEYLDADRRGPAREIALSLAHRAAGYLIARQVTRAGDPRDGLVRGGTGTIHYELDRGAVREVLEPGDIEWVSVEHNIDSYFFLRALARVTQMHIYADAAERIAHALVAHAWSDTEGQFVEGLGQRGADKTLALDCAAWGSIWLGSVGDTARAAIALRVADRRYASRDIGSDARGHRPYASGPLLADERLMRHFAPAVGASTWDELQAVWPEGSAGVALAAWRAGHLDRARSILDALEPLRAGDGSLPTSTVDVPFTLDTRPGLAGTAWVELVRFELERPAGHPTLWAP